VPCAPSVIPVALRDRHQDHPHRERGRPRSRSSSAIVAATCASAGPWSRWSSAKRVTSAPRPCRWHRGHSAAQIPHDRHRRASNCPGWRSLSMRGRQTRTRRSPPTSPRTPTRRGKIGYAYRPVLDDERLAELPHNRCLHFLSSASVVCKGSIWRTCFALQCRRCWGALTVALGLRSGQGAR
jgi:hypothetical protein